MKVWHWCNIQYLTIPDNTDQLGFSVVEIFPAAHSITVSCCSATLLAPYLEKRMTWSLTDMRLFDDSPYLSTAGDHVTACIKLVCSLCDKSHEEYNINYFRNKLFTQKSLTVEKLLPTFDSLLFNLQRANYQCYAWKIACTPILELPSPVENE